MLNYRNNKTRYKINSLGSLYIDERKLSSHEQPIIYVGGQMEHRGHIIEQTGFTFDKNHNMYTGSWMYDYSIFSKDKSLIKAENFSESLLMNLKEAKLHEVILVIHSHGGLIGSYASKSDIIDKVISFHPPILGTPLAKPEEIKENDILFNKAQKLIIKLMKCIVDSEYGFENDNFMGVDFRKVDLNKLLVIGNYIDVEIEKNKLILEIYKLIKKINGCRSDGVVIFEPALFERIGINYLQSDKNANHIDSSEVSYIENNLKRVLIK